MNKAALKKYIAVIRRACDLIEAEMGTDELERLLDQAVAQVAAIQQPSTAPIYATQPSVAPIYKTPEPPIEWTEIQKPEVMQSTPPSPAPSTVLTSEDAKQRAARKKHVEDLMAIDCWPEAIPNFKMASDGNPKDHIDRANSVLDMSLGNTIEESHILDFGCGEGWIARQAAKRGAASVTGFDIVSSELWSTHKDVKFTTNFEDLEQYDVIFLYDVLDHTTDPIRVMDLLSKLISPEGLIYVRCHPWTSKHASHLPKKGLNKAYIHLFLTWEELKDLGFEPMFTRQERNPFEAYHWWFHNFKIERERKSQPETVSDFFKVPSFKELIATEQHLDQKRIEGFFKDMEIQFVDYVLSPSTYE